MTSPAAQVKAFATRLLSLEDDALRALQPVFAAARAEIEAALGSALSTGGTYTEAAAVRMHRMLGIGMGHGGGLQGANRKVLTSLGEQIERATGGSVDWAKTGSTGTMDTLRALGRRYRDLPLGQIEEAARFVTKGRHALIADRYRAATRRYSTRTLTDVRQQLAIGLSKGESIEGMSRRLSKLGGMKGAVKRGLTNKQLARLGADGLAARARNNAERMVRTELAHAYNAGAMDTIRAAAALDPRIRAVWDASNDRRVCLTCRALDGETVVPGDLFPGGLPHPPAHPHCRCAVNADVSP